MTKTTRYKLYLLTLYPLMLMGGAIIIPVLFVLETLYWMLVAASKAGRDEWQALVAEIQMYFGSLKAVYTKVFWKKKDGSGN